jgi:putative endonuclease
MYYVYILFLRGNGNLYTGSTSDLNKRLKNHTGNKVISTKNRSPVLIHYECYKLKSDAQKRERFLKTTEGKRLLRQQLRDILKSLGYSE